MRRYALLRRYAAAAEAWPSVRFVLGHAGARDLPDALPLARRPNVWLESASPGASALAEALAAVGPEKLVFGSDWPFYPVAASLAKVLLVTRDDRRARALVLRENAERILRPAPAGGTEPGASAAAPPHGFVSLAEVEPSILLDIRYARADNFVGAPVDGYGAPRAWLSEPAARALQAVQRDLEEQGLGLVVFDAYRPQRAVDHFLRWTATPEDPRQRAAHHPRVPKGELVARGYIAARSGHSRGSSVDAGLARRGGERATEILDMGTPFDFFDERSRADSAEVSEEARARRALLRGAMMRRGFLPYEHEWWHFTLGSEPWPDTFFDVPLR
jgi:D-alanyl-D-alanine dipeptidase